jgi:hypothetical protein
MKLRKDKVCELMVTYADDNYHQFARLLSLDVAHVHRTLNKKSNAGPKFLGALMVFCNDYGLNFQDYIFLEQPLTACNDGGAILDKTCCTVESKPQAS